ncbi:hypothetical protein H9P43_006631 [Blastocladiella emersonii ATCC 22665]|nr:hypothetical protein H9P43_006631 [Blastocladiella emersonii ATCC 22665]
MGGYVLPDHEILPYKILTVLSLVFSLASLVLCVRDALGKVEAPPAVAAKPVPRIEPPPPPSARGGTLAPLQPGHDPSPPPPDDRAAPETLQRPRAKTAFMRRSSSAHYNVGGGASTAASSVRRRNRLRALRALRTALRTILANCADPRWLALLFTALMSLAQACADTWQAYLRPGEFPYVEMYPGYLAVHSIPISFIGSTCHVMMTARVTEICFKDALRARRTMWLLATAVGIVFPGLNLGFGLPVALACEDAGTWQTWTIPRWLILTNGVLPCMGIAFTVYTYRVAFPPDAAPSSSRRDSTRRGLLRFWKRRADNKAGMPTTAASASAAHLTASTSMSPIATLTSSPSSKSIRPSTTTSPPSPKPKPRKRRNLLRTSIRNSFRLHTAVYVAAWVAGMAILAAAELVTPVLRAPAFGIIGVVAISVESQFKFLVRAQAKARRRAAHTGEDYFDDEYESEEGGESTGNTVGSSFAASAASAASVG